MQTISFTSNILRNYGRGYFNSLNQSCFTKDDIDERLEEPIQTLEVQKQHIFSLSDYLILAVLLCFLIYLIIGESIKCNGMNDCFHDSRLIYKLAQFTKDYRGFI